MKFNELLDKIRSLKDKIDEQYGEIMQEDQDDLEGLEQDAMSWMAYLGEKYREEKADMDKCAELVDRYKARLKSFERRVEWRRLGIMTLAKMLGGKVRVHAITATVTEGKDKLNIIDMDKVPEEYWTTKTVRELDKDKIMADVKDGLKADWFEMKKGDDSVTIRYTK